MGVTDCTTGDRWQPGDLATGTGDLATSWRPAVASGRTRETGDLLAICCDLLATTVATCTGGTMSFIMR
eukprot:366621-Prymnesium_polylepis.1